MLPSLAPEDTNVNLYGIALFFHIIGLIALFSGLVILQRGGVRLRTAATWEEARVWLQLLRPVGGMFLAGSIFLLATGLYMARIGWTFRAPWVVVAEVFVVTFALVGAVVGRGLARMGRAAREHAGEISSDDQHLLRAPAVWASIFAMNGGAMGMVWLMTTKPDWAISIAVPAILMLAGAVVGMSVSKSRREPESTWQPMAGVRERHAS